MMAVSTRGTTLIVGAVVVAAAIAGLLFLSLTGNTTQKIDAEASIPLNAFAAPADWKLGYVFDDKFFAPNSIIIRVGESIRWTNKDSAVHTVTSVKVPNGVQSFNSDTMDPGKQAVFAFKVPGEYEYFCKIHPFMAGKIQILP